MELCIGKPGVSHVTRKPRSGFQVKQSQGFGRKFRPSKEAIGLKPESKLPESKQDSVLKDREPLRQKRLRKEVSLSAFQFGNKRRRNGSNGLTVKPNASALGLKKQETAIKLNESPCNVSTFNGNANTLHDVLPLIESQKKDRHSLSDVYTASSAGDCVGQVAGVERQHPGYLKRKRSQSSSNLKRLAYDSCVKSSDEADSVAACSRNRSAQVLSKERKKKLREFKEIKDSEAEDCVRDDCGNKSYGGIQEDGDENLEHNAARMLCSLLDERCTAFSGNRMTSQSKRVNGSLLMHSTTRKSKGSLREGARVDGAGRVLRPRRIGKSFIRKRRHFYEVSLRDLNPLCIVKQRIRVFWPLDKSWYFGQVKEYDPVTRMHYVRYDDRDEEWINLQNERFKLLLFPSEVSNKCYTYTYSKLDSKPKNVEGNERDVDDNSVGSSVESEPIISWLVQSAHRIKLSKVGNVNKQNRTNSTHGYPNRDSELSISFDTKNSLKISAAMNNGDALVLNSRSTYRDTNSPFIYIRKRFRKRKEGFICISEWDSAPLSINALAQLRHVSLPLSLPLKFAVELVCGAYNFRLSHSLFMRQYGTLVHVWPFIHLEIDFVDHDWSLRLVLAEVCLSSAVSFLCLLLKIFHRCSEECKIKELQMPFTLIRFQISGMHGSSRLKFVLSGFSRLKNSKWQCVEEKFKHYSVKIKGLSYADCTFSDIKDLEGGSGQAISSSVDLHLPEEPLSNSVEECPEMIRFSSPDKSVDGCESCMNTFNITNEKGKQPTDPISSSVCRIDKHLTRTSNLTALRTMWQRSRHTSLSRAFGDGLSLWQEDLLRNGFPSGSKKPRSKISYSFSPHGEQRSKYRRRHHKLLTNKNVKINDSKKSFLDSLICKANVLVTDAYRGWRECDAEVLLDSDDQSEWRICTKLSGTTKYVHKVHQFLQPRTANRYTHSIMWRGGKDWCLEFTDRVQWSLFKQIHEECYNRNIRAASARNIPTPGVHLVSDFQNDKIEASFVRGSKYSLQAGTDIDTALDPSNVLYDMDSDDEEWLSSVKGHDVCEAMEDLFERVMDKFEKFAYCHNCDVLAINQIEELMANDGPLEIISSIHDYWRAKRQKKGMPLIRQLQPALWKYYQHQLLEWESAMSKMHESPDGCQEWKCSIKKPPMFAFCLRPRGLKVPSKCSKPQRSHKKLLFSGHHSAYAREQDASKIGRKSNDFADWEENTLSVIPDYEPSDSSDCFLSPLAVSPYSTASNSKKSGMFPSSEDFQIAPSFPHQNKLKRREHYWNDYMYEWPNSKRLLPDPFHNDRADVDELRLRDASSAAQHALTMAKLKREKAKWLVHKADLAIHRATVALMTAEAIRSSERGLFRED